MPYDLPNSDKSTDFPLIRKLSLIGIGAAGLVMLPPNAFIERIVARNNTANAITGGLKFGTSAGATDIVAALAVGASGLVFVTDALTLKRYFSKSAPQPIYIDAVVAWNSANADISIMYYQF